MNTNKKMKQILAGVERVKGTEKKTYWNRVGTAFENRDGSWNLLFDLYPANPSTTIQLRDIEPSDPREE